MFILGCLECNFVFFKRKSRLIFLYMEYILFGYIWIILFHMSRNEMVLRFEITFFVSEFPGHQFSGNHFSEDQFSGDQFSADHFSGDQFSADHFSGNHFSRGPFFGDHFSAYLFSETNFRGPFFSRTIFPGPFFGDHFFRDPFAQVELWTSIKRRYFFLLITILSLCTYYTPYVMRK